MDRDSHNHRVIHVRQPYWDQRECKNGLVRAEFPCEFEEIFFVVVLVSFCPRIASWVDLRLRPFTQIFTMAVLIIISIVHWARIGNSQIVENWAAGRIGPLSEGTDGSSVARQIFRGFCLGMLGLTGFECECLGFDSLHCTNTVLRPGTPAYLSRIKPGRLPLVLRNLHYPAIILNSVLMTLVLGLIPLEEILGGNNVLSLLGDKAGGRWLRIWITVDAIVVLCGGVLTGESFGFRLPSALWSDNTERRYPLFDRTSIPALFRPSFAQLV